MHRDSYVRSAQVKNEVLSPSRLDARRAQTFGPSLQPVDRFLSLPMVDPSRPTGNDDRTADRENNSSAAGEAEPSSSGAPIISNPLLTRKSRTVKRLTDEPTPHTVRQRVRLVTSRVTSSLSKGGNGVSRFVGRSARPEGSGGFNPSFDPWEKGYVPPRGPSQE